MNPATLIAALLPLIILAVLFAAIKFLLPALKKPIGLPQHPARMLYRQHGQRP